VKREELRMKNYGTEAEDLEIRDLTETIKILS
jgi:hypothetical protein